MQIITLVCVILVIIDSAVSTNEEHLVCRRADDRDVDPTGRPGKRGQKGMKGDPGLIGPVGPPGLVNYNIVNSNIDVKVQQAISELSARVADLEINLRVCPHPGRKVIFNRKCFWAIVSGRPINYDQGVDLCREIGATPANVYSEKHFRLLVEYLQTVTGEFLYVWLGMKYTSSTERLTNYDGTPGKYARWRPGHPTANSQKNGVIIDAYQPSDTRSPGMLNQPPMWGKLGVLCEKE